MTARYLDISMCLEPGIPIWPGSTGFSLGFTQHLSWGDEATVSHLEMDVHVGTHVDAPAHFVRNGATIDGLDPELLIGPATVVEVGNTDITDRILKDICPLPVPKRILLRTANSQRWGAPQDKFCTDYVALQPSGARWLVEKGIQLVGIDALSIQSFGQDSRTHQILLSAGVVVLEGLDLSQAQPGGYELICLPLRLIGAEGAPARALLRPMPHSRESGGA